MILLFSRQCNNYYFFFSFRHHDHFHYHNNIIIITEVIIKINMPYSDPKYPVVNPSPDVDDCIKSMRIRDMALAFGVTSASWSFGYLVGKPARMPTASTAAAIGLTFAGLMIIQDTRGRLMGYCENSREVKKYGVYATPASSKVQVGTDAGSRRFPVAISGLQSVKPTPEYKNYD